MLPHEYKFVTETEPKTGITVHKRLLNYNILGKAIKKVYNIIYFESS